MLWCSSLSCSKKLLFGPFLLKCSQMTANFVKIVFKKIGYSLLDKKVKMQFLRLKKRKYAHPSNKRSPLSFSERLFELSLHAKSSPYTVIYIDTAFLVIGSICDKKSFELLSRISEDWRYTEMLCFKRACVWTCLFFHEAYLRRIHAVTTKKWTERRDARAKLSFSLQKPIVFFCHSRCRRGRRIRLLKLTRLEGWSSLSGKLFSIKTDSWVPHCTHDSFRSMKLGWCYKVIVVPCFFLTQCHVSATCQHKLIHCRRRKVFYFFICQRF